MQKRLLFILALLGAVAVVLGAFGAHALKGKLSDYQAEIYNKGILYHFVHVLAGLCCILLGQQLSRRCTNLAVWFFIAGIVCFSGSLYLLAIRDLIGMHNINWLIPITPLGGVCFIIGWVSLAVGALKK